MSASFGVSYRPDWDLDLSAYLSELDCFELILEQVELLDPRIVEQIVTRPLALHSVSLSVGSAEPMREERLDGACRAVSRLKPKWLGVHMAITEICGVELNQLTPILFTRGNVEVLVDHICRLRDRIGVDVLLENIAYYFEPIGDDYNECEIITEILEQADCGLLLDLNNLHVNSHNFGYDPAHFLRSIPLDRVKQVHLAGFEITDGMRVDTHNQATSSDVFALLEMLGGEISSPMIIIERDGNIPPLSEMIAELERAKSAFHRAHRGMHSQSEGAARRL